MDEDQDYEYDDYDYDEDEDEDQEFRTSSSDCSDIAKDDSPKLCVPVDSYVIQKTTEVTPLMLSLVDQVVSVLNITADEARALLRYMKWNKEALLDRYYSDAHELRESCGLDLFDKNCLNMLNNPVSAGEAMKCRICYDETPRQNGFWMGCNHPFCRDCYSEYLKSKVSDGPSCVVANCPEFKCKQLVTHSIFQHFLAEDERKRYDSYFLRNFVEMSRNMTYCPAPDCNHVAIGTGVTTVHCVCDRPFCLKCGDEAHDPCSCAQLLHWKEKCQDESETANWILANTRKCPNCHTRIEKNHGCNHMTCSKCKFEFCWICMADWALHSQSTGGYYKCNRYDLVTASSNVSAAERAKAELDRYLHYYKRYHGHDSALKHALNKKNEIDTKIMSDGQKSHWMDMQYLKQAAWQVIECRRVLKYTYVLGYTLKELSPEKQLFEHHQEMLEKNTEKLHEYMECENITPEHRTATINLTRVTEKFMSALLQNMTGGVVLMDEQIMPMIGDARSPMDSKSISPQAV